MFEVLSLVPVEPEVGRIVPPKESQSAAVKRRGQEVSSQEQQILTTLVRSSLLGFGGKIVSLRSVGICTSVLKPRNW